MRFSKSMTSIYELAWMSPYDHERRRYGVFERITGDWKEFRKLNYLGYPLLELNGADWRLHTTISSTRWLTLGLQKWIIDIVRTISVCSHVVRHDTWSSQGRNSIYLCRNIPHCVNFYNHNGSYNCDCEILNCLKSIYFFSSHSLIVEDCDKNQQALRDQ